MPTPAPGTKTAAEAVAAAVAMLEDVDTALSSASDCEARAAALKGWQQANGARLAEVRTALHAQDRKALGPEVQRQMQASAKVKNLFTQAQTCMTNTAFADVWEGISKVMD